MPGKYKLVRCGICRKLVPCTGKLNFTCCKTKQPVRDNYVRHLSYDEYVILKQSIGKNPNNVRTGNPDRPHSEQSGNLPDNDAEDVEVTTEDTAEANNVDVTEGNLDGILESFTGKLRENHPNTTPKSAGNLRKQSGESPRKLSAIEMPSGDISGINITIDREIPEVKRDFFGFKIIPRKKHVKLVSEDKRDMYGFMI